MDKKKLKLNIKSVNTLDEKSTEELKGGNGSYFCRTLVYIASCHSCYFCNEAAQE